MWHLNQCQVAVFQRQANVNISHRGNTGEMLSIYDARFKLKIIPVN